MLTQLELRRLAREKIESEKLPCAEHPSTWGGKGRGSACSLCEESITNEQFEFEVEIVAPACPAPAILSFHLSCHGAWLDECSETPRKRA